VLARDRNDKIRAPFDGLVLLPLGQQNPLPEAFAAFSGIHVASAARQATRQSD
jgi:hypothetical protein